MAAFPARPAPPGGVPTNDISPAELSHRVAVLKRFKELLKAQRDRFEAYLSALDNQKDVIRQGTADDLLRHVELEEKIVSDIFSMQKVIDPLEKMYQSVRTDVPAGASRAGGFASGASRADSSGDSGEDEVVGLKEALEGLKAEAVIRSERNRELLAKRMAELRSEMKSMRSGAYSRKRFDNGPAPSLIDLKG